MTAAAICGLMSGVAIHQSRADTSTNAAPGQAAPLQKEPKVSGCAGQNDCKGIGGCKTDAHACKFLNPCKGKGGCEVTDKDVQKWEKDHQQASTNAAPKSSGQ